MKKQITELAEGMGDESLFEEKLSSEEIFEGRVLRVTRDCVRLPNGRQATREVAWHNGAVAILPVFDDGTVLIEHQYRYPHGRTVLEIPAGKLDTRDEEPLSAAKRELREETGLVASRWTELGVTIPSVAILSERITVYAAEGLSYAATAPDEDEFLILERMPFDKLLALVLSGKIEDSKTQVAVLKYFAMKEKSRHENSIIG